MAIGGILTIGFVLCLFIGVDSYSGQIPIGAIFDRYDVESQKALEYAFAKHKEKAATRDPFFQLNLTTDAIDINDNFQIARAICRQMTKGVFAILGQKTMQSADIVRSLTSTFHMPYITTSPSSVSVNNNSYELHMRPDHTAAMADIIEVLEWDTVHFLYDSDEGLQRLQNIHRRMRNDSVQWFSMMRFTDVRDVYDDLTMVDNPSLGYKAFVLDLSSEEAYASVLKQDIQSFNLSRFQHGGVNITGFQLFEDSTTRDLAQSIQKAKEMDGMPEGDDGLPVRAALTVDGLSVIEEAISGMLGGDRDRFRWIFRRGELYNLNITRGIPCDTTPPRAWMFGESLLKEMKKNSPQGLSGPLSFTEGGSRHDYNLGVYSMGLDTGLRKIGSWNPHARFVGVNERDSGDDLNGMGRYRDGEDNETKIIISILSDPFLMKAKGKDGDPQPMGNKQFEGYSLDLAKKLAGIVDFKFEFRIVNDSNYGKYVNGSWNGIIGEILAGKGDLAIAPLTITAERERFVDFSKPFMEVGVTIMIKKPQKQKPGVFSFMEPLSIEVWFCIIIAYLTVSVALFLVSRFSPLEWRRDDAGEIDSYHNDFSLFNSFWFSMGALMFQGSDSCPRSASGRIIGGAWWFFVLIIISSYTANLAAFLTIERMIPPIESADDLVNHPDIKYGAVSSGTTLPFFQNSEVPVYRQMGAYMTSHSDVLVKTNEEGFQRVLSSKGKYAFLAESATVEYANYQKPCETTTVGGKLNHKGFGVATPRNSKLRDPINVAVLKLKEDGTLYQLYQNWWVEKGQCGAADGKKDKFSLTLSNVAGIFYILIVGLVFAIILGVLEYMCFKAKHKTEDTVTGECYLKGTNTQSTLCLPQEREESAFIDTLQSPPEQRGFIGFEKFHADYTANMPKTT